MTKYAISISIKNEQNLIKNNILYHIKKGAACIYVYFDGTTDASREIVEGFSDKVVSRNSVMPREINFLPGWIAEIAPRWEENMDVRKRINAYHAALEAKNAGYDWLFVLDADELLYFDGVDNISDFLKKINSSVDQIYVRNLEAVPPRADVKNPFEECTIFLNRFPNTELVYRYSTALFRRIVRFPVIQAWFEYAFYQVRFLGGLPRLLEHPTSKIKIPAPFFLGYTNCKSGMRLSTFEKFNFNVHKWKKYTGTPKSIYAGNLLHYDLCSVEYFKLKFRQRQVKMLVPEFYCRYMLASIAINEPDDVCLKFFEKNIAVSDSNLIEKLKKKGIVRYIDDVKISFQETMK